MTDATSVSQRSEFRRWLAELAAKVAEQSERPSAPIADDECFEGRAAIMEYEGGLSRAAAEFSHTFAGAVPAFLASAEIEPSYECAACCSR